jgi:hypothetical protein
MNDARVDAYLAQLNGDVARAATALRDVLAGASPKLAETFKWAQPVYEANGPVCGFKAHKAHVTLVFWRGAALRPLNASLETSGEKMAHIKFASAREIKAATIKKLVRAAITLNEEQGDPTKRR